MKKYFATAFYLFLVPFIFAQDVQKQLQTQFIMVEDGETITLKEGMFKLIGTLSMDGKKNVTIKGAGMDKTILSWTGQTEGAEGIKITDSENITLEGFTVQDAKGDLIKVQGVKGITFRKIKAEWTGEPKAQNGGYGLYPVQCEKVLIEDSEAIGASDSGIYVGQSDQVIVRRSRAFHNVAGIEIENTTNADVYENESTGNTGGVLVFDLPGLLKKQGGYTRIFNNNIHHNNLGNFAPGGNMVATVPAGTGVIILAANHVEVFNNRIIGHKSASSVIISYYLTEIPITDAQYNPFPSNIYIHNNTFQRARAIPDLDTTFGKLLTLKFRNNVPNVVFDGILKPDWSDGHGNLKPEYRICVAHNNANTYANLDAGNKFRNFNRDASKVNCTLPSLPEVKF
jgi:parallel beta-helix repeat protein